MNWLTEAMTQCPLTEEVEGYLLGRGAKWDLIEQMGFKTWVPLRDPSPDPVFRDRYGDRGQQLSGCLMTPLYSPRGIMIGVQSRGLRHKSISRYLLPEGQWNPIWMGVREALPRMWSQDHPRACVWLVEGIFDLLALQWVIPPCDVILGAMTAGLSRAQVAFLSRMGCPVKVAFDMDQTGQRGTQGWIDDTGKYNRGVLDWLRAAGLPCTSVEYTGGKDPGEIWDKGGAPALQQAFANYI